MYMSYEGEMPFWAVQEINLSEDGSVAQYGGIPYRAPLNMTEMMNSSSSSSYNGKNKNINNNPIIPPAAGWTPADAQYEPAPQVKAFNMTLSDRDCGDALSRHACIMFFIRQFERETFPKERTHEPGMPTCRELSNIVRELSDEEIEQYRKAWELDGTVAIRNVLKPEIAAEWRRELLMRPMPDDFWFASFWDAERDTSRLIDRSPENAGLIQEWLKKQHDQRNRGRYAYSFTRTSDYVKEEYYRFYRTYHDDVVDLLESTRLRETLFDITFNNYELSTYFLAKYLPGDL